MRKPLFCVIVVLLLIGSSAMAQSQEPATEAEQDNPTTDDVGDDSSNDGLDRARRKLEVLGRARAQAERIVDEFRTATGDERDLLRIEGLKVLDDLRDLSGEIIELLADLEAPPDVIDPLRNATVEHLQYQGGLVLQDRRRKDRRLADMRHRRSTLSADELAEFEDRLNDERVQLDLGQALGREVVERLELLGADATELRSEIESLTHERAETLMARLQLAVAARDRIEEQIRSAEQAGVTEELVETRSRARAVELRIEGIVGSLRKTADHLQQWGIETAEYRQMLIVATGEITEDVLDTDVLVGLFRDAASSAIVWTRDRGPTVLFKFLVALAMIPLFRWGGVLVWVAVRIFARPSNLLAGMIGRMIRPMASALGLFVGLWFLGVNTAALLTGVGVAGLVLGFALQDSLGNLAAGIFILLYRPFDEGDVVSAGGVLGSVKEMGLANTTLITFDNRRVYIPNRKVWGDVIENRSAEERRRIDTTVRIKYEEDIDKALSLIRDILNKHELVLEDPQPGVFVSELDDSSIEISVRPWATKVNWWPLYTDLPRALRVGLLDAGIKVPYPRQDILLAPGSEYPGG